MDGAEESFEPIRVGIFGGSFNPPHVAHVLAAAYALLVAPIDRVVIVPVFCHPFSKELASFEDRLAMCRLAFEALPHVEISTVEQELGGESRTLRTVEHLKALHPDWRLRLLLGSDVVPDLPKWHRFDRIAEIAEPFVIERRGATSDEARALLPEVSSTEIRALFERGAFDELASLVPRRVLEYARERGLYALSAEG
ncbi:MAG: nicotinate (nicotinamide) nucleotide adenylyltransferase [Polyangiaceae bacterium]|nr:nicotinate (nicotinamide) nucleotide adenylyltransferase [Polyangiaceae bacterium]